MSERNCNILDMPDDILVEIFLHFNARERLELTETCTRFSDLVFGHQELLRVLDFSKNGRLTTAIHIREYFSNEITWQYLRKFNLQNVKCMTSGHMLNESIGKAINLVDLNILGVKFLDIKQLGSFLEPLINVKRLSIKWPRLSSDESSNCNKILEKPFSRITYLMIEVPVSVRNFLSVLKFCQELIELHVVTPGDSGILSDNFSHSQESGKLTKLRIIQLYMHSSIRKELLAIVPDPQEWTDFQLCDRRGVIYHYYEKNLEICEKIRASKLAKNISRISHDDPAIIHPSTFGWRLIPEILLNEVIRITHKDIPEIFCSLINTTNIEFRPFLMKIDEAKRLLKDPEYQISYLNLTHKISPDCDAHLVASAFPNLTKLRLNSIRISKTEEATLRQKKHYRRRLRRRINTTSSEERDDPENVDSSFKMLIENTPHVQSLTISPSDPMSERDNEWDFESLCLIPSWNNLRSLYLVKIPVRDGKFLINIGRECKQLEKLVLQELWDVGDDKLRVNSYTNDLPEMFSHCKSLKKFSIHHNKLIKNLSQMLVSLSGNLNIKRVRITKLFCSHSYEFNEIIPSIKKLIHRCKKLITFVFITDNKHPSPDELIIALERIKGELNRPKLQFGTAKHPDPDFEEINNTFACHEDASTSIY